MISKTLPEQTGDQTSYVAYLAPIQEPRIRLPTFT